MGGLFRGFFYFLITWDSPTVTEGPDKDDWYVKVCILRSGKLKSEKLR